MRRVATRGEKLDSVAATQAAGHRTRRRPRRPLLIAPAAPSRRSRTALWIALAGIIVVAAVLTIRSSRSSGGRGGAPVTSPVPSASAGTTRPSLPPPDPANVIWRGDLESGNLDQYNHRNFAGAPNSDRAVVYSKASQPDWPVPRQGTYAVRLRAQNGDVAPRTPTSNPRAQVDSPIFWQEGDDAWVGWSTYFPNDFPTELGRTNAWFTFLDVYGEPYRGSGALTFSVDYIDNKQSVSLSRGAESGSGQAWSTPLKRGVWHDFVLHAKLSRDPSVGYVELWYDGAQQTLLDGVRRLPQVTAQQDVSDHNFQVNVTNYRAVNGFRGNVTVFQDAVVAGRSYAAVAPRSDTS